MVRLSMLPDDPESPVSRGTIPGTHGGTGNPPPRFRFAMPMLPRTRDSRIGAVLEHASGDKRFKILEVFMKRHMFRADALIEVLHKAQKLFGYLEDDLLIFVAHHLRLPPSRVYGVATFYHFFTLKPKGEHTCVVCLGTACYVKGANKVQAAVEALTGITAGETTPDNKVSLLTARCIGACGVAPAVTYDGQVAAKQTPEDAVAKIKQWTGHDAE